ncbi:MAG: hypothetical protein EA402_02120 [Planctomycetota bacterium]|nr:MAG: hypothetical protein EA402_02120 [Planctomycetota bacterium]
MRRIHCLVGSTGPSFPPPSPTCWQAPPMSDNNNTPVQPSEPAAPVAGPSGFRTSRSHTQGRHPLIQILGYLSSMWSAAIMLGLLIVVTGIATYYERDFGRVITAHVVYQSWWFNTIFALLAINIFGAAAVRFPWTKRQAGFVITHAGLLTVMLGFAIAGGDGARRLDGMLAAPQGEPARLIELNREVLNLVVEETGQRSSVAFRVTDYANYPSFLRYTADMILRNTTGHRLIHEPEVSPANQRVKLTEIAGHPVFLRRVVDTAAAQLAWAPASEGPSAVRMRLDFHGEAFGPESGRSQQIVVPRGQRLDMGPMVISHHQRTLPPAIQQLFALPLPEDSGPLGDLIILIDYEHEQILQQVPLQFQLNDESNSDSMQIQTIRDGDPFQVALLDYFPEVEFNEQGQPRPVSDEPLAPLLALRLGFAGDDGSEEINWLSPMILDGLNFLPNQIIDNMWVLWRHPTLWKGLPDQERGLVSHLDFFHLSNGEHFLIRSSTVSGVSHRGLVEPGWKNEANMGVGEIITHFEAYLPHVAREPRRVVMDAMMRDRAANWIELQIGEGPDAQRHWLRRNTAETLRLPTGQEVLVTYGRQQYDLLDRHGFEITLQRFINEKDPGGQGNATYTSLVRVRYADSRPAVQAEISMNEPLHEGGVTLYQTARAEQPDGTFVSFFTVAQDRGRPFKYLGSLLLVAGILTMYFMKAKGRRKRSPPPAA